MSQADLGERNYVQILLAAVLTDPVRGSGNWTDPPSPFGYGLRDTLDNKNALVGHDT